MPRAFLSEPYRLQATSPLRGFRKFSKGHNLRIGLTRGWELHPDRCYLQVTAVHTFPDYLKGLTFAEFAPSWNSR